MEDGIVRYEFEWQGQQLTFDVNTQPHDLDEIVEGPEWTRLGNNQCACCPLKEADCGFCPAATRMHRLLEEFKDTHSIDRVNVTVHTPSRRYVADVDMQVGLNSLLGLLMATSGCPVLSKLGAMANLHVPFCSVSETLHRTVGSYLTQQYFIQKNGGEPDWALDGLKELYGTLEGLNQDFSRRIQGYVSSDALSNAVIMFFATSVVVSSSLDAQLERYEPFLTNKKLDVVC
ncbi:MAG: DUF6901 family protein [Coraliomargarita sp.]